MATWLLASTAIASPRDILMIDTTKPLGPSPGQFSTSGVFVESGSFFTEQRIVSALPAPFGVVTHLRLRFEGQNGTFTIRVEIMETVTANPNALYGTGDVEGTVDDAANLITREYTGLVHFK